MIDSHAKIAPQHLARSAVVYVRQSSIQQVRNNHESRTLQYRLEDRARSLGWNQVDIVDEDLGISAGGCSVREGFDRLVSYVTRAEVGIIFCLEASRLSRNDADWARLLQVCGLFDTLVADSDSIYDLCRPDDQMILGIKGTLSVMELTYLRRRMVQGQEEKARRGELEKQLPAGYVYADGTIVKIPDIRVQEAVQLVFTRFRELWSIRQTMKWFQDEGIDLPVHRYVDGKRVLRWEPATQPRVGAILRNPIYGGAYAYGRRQQEVVFKDGRVQKRTGGYLPAEKWKVLIRDHHEAYISWETYEENLRKVTENSLKLGGDTAAGAVRSGQGLLAGLLRCGRCGHKLQVRYWGKSGTVPRYLCQGDFGEGGSYCLGFSGGAVDRRLGQEIVRAIQPLSLEASLQALDLQRHQDSERRGALERQVQQYEFEAQRAFEQYDQVDPRNRLVALELERRWNEKLAEVEAVRGQLQELGRSALTVDESVRARILRLGSRFDRVWSAPGCPAQLKKKIARILLEEIVADLDEETNTLRFVLHWRGGVHTEVAMARPTSPFGRKTTREDQEIIGKMVGFYDDDEIAAVLNRLGRRTAKGKRWSKQRVATVRQRYRIPPREDREERGTSILSAVEAARYCAVSTATIRKLAARGLLPYIQVCPYAPWEIRTVDLDSDPVRAHIDHLKRRGHLPSAPQGGVSREQIELFPN